MVNVDFMGTVQKYIKPGNELAELFRGLYLWLVSLSKVGMIKICLHSNYGAVALCPPLDNETVILMM